MQAGHVRWPARCMGRSVWWQQGAITHTRNIPCDIVLCHCCACNHDCCWVLYLHFP
jgi:hypothetical protein